MIDKLFNKKSEEKLQQKTASTGWGQKTKDFRTQMRHGAKALTGIGNDLGVIKSPNKTIGKLNQKAENIRTKTLGDLTNKSLRKRDIAKNTIKNVGGFLKNPKDENRPSILGDARKAWKERGAVLQPGREALSDIQKQKNKIFLEGGRGFSSYLDDKSAKNPLKRMVGRKFFGDGNVFKSKMERDINLSDGERLMGASKDIYNDFVKKRRANELYRNLARTPMQPGIGYSQQPTPDQRQYAQPGFKIGSFMKEDLFFKNLKLAAYEGIYRNIKNEYTPTNDVSNNRRLGFERIEDFLEGYTDFSGAHDSGLDEGLKALNTGISSEAEKRVKSVGRMSNLGEHEKKIVSGLMREEAEKDINKKSKDFSGHYTDGFNRLLNSELRRHINSYGEATRNNDLKDELKENMMNLGKSKVEFSPKTNDRTKVEEFTNLIKATRGNERPVLKISSLMGAIGTGVAATGIGLYAGNKLKTNVISPLGAKVVAGADLFADTQAGLVPSARSMSRENEYDRQYAKRLMKGTMSNIGNKTEIDENAGNRQTGYGDVPFNRETMKNMYRYHILDRI